MKKIAFGFVLAVSVVGCHASVRVQASTPAPEPPRVEEPAPAPAPLVSDHLELPEQIEFEHDQARLKQTPRTQATLEQLAEIMKTHPTITKLRIEGHTDSTGRPKHNEKLSKARAEAVARWLVDHDIEASRLATVGFGAKSPLVPNDSADHRAQNRRTEYFIEEMDGKRFEASAEKVAGGAPTSGKTSN